MGDIIVFRFFFPIFLVILLAVPMVANAYDTKDVVQLAAREGARKASVVYDPNAVEQRVQDTISGSGKPLTYDGVTLFDPTQDVTINWNDGDHVTVTVDYQCYLLTPTLLTMIGGHAIGPTIDIAQTASFEREW